MMGMGLAAISGEEDYDNRDPVLLNVYYFQLCACKIVSEKAHMGDRIIGSPL